MGGVASHYSGLKDYWSEDVTYNFVGSRRKLPGGLTLPFDLLLFMFKLTFCKYDVVILNPSLRGKAIFRDALFLFISSIFKVKVITFFHGWSEEVAEKIELNPDRFVKYYGKSDAFFVLSKKIENKMRHWGIDKDIFITTTKVDDKLLSYKVPKCKEKSTKTILFLGRVEEYKGIFIVIESFKLLKERFSNIELIIAGDGSKLFDCKKIVSEQKILGVKFLGNIKDSDVANAFASSDVYVLPSFSEGLPTSMLEAMAFGLPVITTPVGGIPEIFEVGEMGYLLDGYKPEELSDKISQIIIDDDKSDKMSQYNKEYANNHFLASIVSKKIEQSVRNVLNKG